MDAKEDLEGAGKPAVVTPPTTATTASSSPAETPSGSLYSRGPVEGLGTVSPRTIKKVMNAEPATDNKTYYIKEEGSKFNPIIV